MLVVGLLLGGGLGAGSAHAQNPDPVSTVTDDGDNDLMTLFDNGDLTLFQNGNLTTPGLIESTGGGFLLPDGTQLTNSSQFGQLSLPFSGSVSSNNPSFDIENTGAGDAIKVSGAGSDGVQVNDARIGFYALSPTQNGVRVTGASEDGIRVNDASGDGIHVSSSGEFAGRFVGLSSGSIVNVLNAGSGDGIRVSEAGGDGLQVNNAENGFHADSPNQDGVRVTGAGRDGINVQDASRNGISVSGSGSIAGQFAGSSSVPTVSVRHIGGEDAIRIPEAGGDGVEVRNAVNGLFANAPSANGVLVSSPSVDDVAVNDAGNNGINVIDASNNGIEVSGSGNLAASFGGDVDIGGDLDVAGSKNFKIDHPQDPTGKYLKHAAVESPNRLNAYTGNVTLDANGKATVRLPDYFQSINRDFRYQLTAIGAAAPRLHVAQEIRGNQFRIAGGKPGMKVSWRVTGIRDDAWARENPFQVEGKKPPEKQGTYRHPEAHGAPPARGEEALERKQTQKQEQKP